MKLKVFKKKIETILFKRLLAEKNYMVFLSSVKNNGINVVFSNVLNYSLKYSIQPLLAQSLINNFLTSSCFSTTMALNLFIKNLKNNIPLIYFIKFKNLYFFNVDSTFKCNFENLNINIYNFILRLQKLLLNWMPLLKLIMKNASK